MLIKEQPGTRKCNYIGQKARRDVLQVAFLAESLLLCKLRTDRTGESYWTLIDATGKIYNLPRTLKRILQNDDFDRVSTKHIQNGLTQLLLQSETKIAAFKFDVDGKMIETLIYPLNQNMVRIDQDFVLCNYIGQLFHVGLINQVQRDTSDNELTQIV